MKAPIGTTEMRDVWSWTALSMLCLGTAVGVEPGGSPSQARTPPHAGSVPREPNRTTISDLRRWTSTAEFVRPSMTREELGDLSRLLQLDGAQSARVGELFETYLRRVERIKEQLFDRIGGAVMEYVQAVESGAALPRERVAEIVRFVGETVQQSRPAAEQTLDRLLVELQASLGEAQLEAYPGAVRAWRRSVMLNPTGREPTGFDLSVHADLFEVIDRSCELAPALRPMLDRRAESPVDPVLAEARERCLELLAAFELELDGLIRRQYALAVDRFVKSARAWAQGDGQATRKANRSERQEWMRIHRASTGAAEAVAAIIEEAAGSRLADTWRELYYAACYPLLYAPKSTDLLHAWLIDEADLAPEQRASVEAVYGQYLETRRAVRAQARSVLLDLARELDLASPAQLPASIATTGVTPARKARLDQWRRTLSEQTNIQFRSLLTDDQGPAFDRVLLRLQRGTRAEPFEF